MKRDKRLKIKEVILTHISNNKKEYFIITLLFIIGIFLGVFFTNNINETEQESIKEYINTFIETLKNSQNINYIELLKNSIFSYVLLALIIWFFGTTVIGIPIVFGIIIYKGFCLGYTISIFIKILGMQQGMTFIFSSIFLQNILIIPATIAIAVSGFKLYKAIVKDRKKETIKMEILRHTIFSLIMIIILCLAGVIEVFASNNLLKWILGQ